MVHANVNSHVARPPRVVCDNILPEPPRAARCARVYPVQEDRDACPYSANNGVPRSSYRTSTFSTGSTEYIPSGCPSMPHILPGPIGARISTAHCHAPAAHDPASHTALVSQLVVQSLGPDSVQVTYSGGVCLGIIAAAFTVAGSAPMTKLLAAATACGAVGCMSTLAALYNGRKHGEESYFLLLGVLCSVTGMICVVAAVQTLAATMITCVGIAGMAALIVRPRFSGS